MSPGDKLSPAIVERRSDLTAAAQPPSPYGATRYRGDIDGLRAVAVLAVVAYHGGLDLVGGGFVGVDVFFVISGYLITGILYREIEAGKFSLWRFYERRVRRILPAFLVVVLAMMAAGWFLLLPSEYESLSKSAIASALSAANLHLYYSVDYFGADSHSQPLLHMWSLAVEEQFYVVFPLLLLVLHRVARRVLRPVLVGLALASLAAAAFWVVRDPSAAFYQPHLRAWELMTGGLLAVFRWTPPSRLLFRNLLACAGLAGILGSVLLLDSTGSFPGLTALPACLGTALIVAAASSERSNVVSWGLSMPPVRFVGLISYSLYLWHWPVIVFMREGAGFLPFNLPEHPVGRMVLLLVLMFSLATLSWWFVERPFRRPGGGAKTVVATGVGAMLACCAVALAVLSQQGFPNRFPPQTARMAQFLEYEPAQPFRSGTCFIETGQTFADFQPEACLTHRPGTLNYMIIGDSHAAHLWWGLSRELAPAHVGMAAASGCKAVIEQPSDAAPRCIDTLRYAFSDGIARMRPDVIILAGRWMDGDSAAVGRTIDALKTRARVVLVGPVPQYAGPLPRVLIATRGSQARIRQAELGFPPRVDEEMRRLAEEKGVTYLSPYQALCDAGGCQTVTGDSDPIQFDYGHLTADGSQLLARKLRAQVAVPW